MTISIKPTASGSTIEQDGSTILTVDGSGNITPSNSMYPKVPAFSAYLETTQVISTNTFTKLQIETKEFDLTSDYDNVTNYRYTPSVAGYYLINLTFFVQTIGDGQISLASIYKNGGELSRGNQGANGGQHDRTATATTMTYMNGSTDYIEFYGYHSHGSNRNALGQRRLNNASAHLVSI